jgi:hypothetical protein
MQSDYGAYVRSHTNGVHFDAIFQDSTGALDDYSAGTFTAMPCGYSANGWLAAEEQLAASTGMPVIFNGPMGNVTPTRPTQSLSLLANNAYLGANFEHCYSDNNQPKMTGWGWVATENSEIGASALNKLFECMARNSNAAAANTDQRLYLLASFLLTYNPQYSVLWEEYGTNSGLHVEPEEQLVPTAPLVPTPSNVSALQLSGGLYGREYARCYLRGQFAAPCAVVVNPDNNFAHTFPFPQYRHTLVLNGGGVLDGGTVSVAGPPPPTYLAPGEATIVFP